MNTELLVSRVLDDETLTGDLDEKAAEALLGWTVHQAEQLAARSATMKAALQEIDVICRHARALGRLVTTICQQHDLTAAAALAKKEGLPWPVGDTSSEEKSLAWLLAREKGPGK
jgi:hypothetical protein